MATITKERVFEILRESKYAISANDIRAQCRIKGLTQNPINRILYESLKEGSVIRVDGPLPKWSLRNALVDSSPLVFTANSNQIRIISSSII